MSHNLHSYSAFVTVAFVLDTRGRLQAFSKYPPVMRAASSALAALFGPPRSGASSPAAPPFKRLELSVKDDEDQNLLDYLPECINFVEEGRAKGAVLVHCVAGVSRRLGKAV